MSKSHHVITACVTRSLPYLQEADEVAEHQFVDVRQTQHDFDGGLGVVVIFDTLIVELVGDQRLLELPVPQLEERSWGHADTVTAVKPTGQVGRQSYQSGLECPGLLVAEEALQVLHHFMTITGMGGPEAVAPPVFVCCVPGMCGSSSPVGIFH